MSISTNVSTAAAKLCVSSTNLYNLTKIANVDINRDGGWLQNTTNITAIPFSPTEDGLDIWVYKSRSDLDASLPVTKPLFVDCPMPVCAFGISGPYADLQRYLIYLNLVLAVLAAAVPVMRGVAQLFLITTSFSSTIHFWVIMNNRTEGFVDMDLLPALSYGLSGVAATYIWTLLRTAQRNLWILQLLLPVFFPFFYYIAIAISLHKFDNNPWGVLLQSETAFRLTSVCYKANDGSVAVWSGQFQSGIRQLSELQFLTPSDTSEGRPAVTSPMTVRTAITIILSVFIGQLLAILISGTRKYCCSGRSCTLEDNVLNLERFPNWLLRLFSAGFQLPDRNRRLVLNSEFFFAFFLLTPGFLGYIAFVSLLEYGIRKHDLPVGEAPNQYSQWGTWVIAAFVAIATIIIQIQTGRSSEPPKDLEGEALVRFEDQ